MTGIVDWAASRARMVLAFVALSIVIGTVAYISLPKEGEPDIEIPALFVSVPFPGISAEDSEKLLVKVMETELSDLDGLDKISATAAEGFAGVILEFEFGWDKSQTIADVRDKMNTAAANFPSGADNYTINEINFSEFPIIVVNLTGSLPERTLLRLAKDLQDTLEGLEPVLEAGLTGQREEMVEVEIDPLLLEAYNVTAGELLAVVQNNNQLIAAGQVETSSGAFSLKIPSAFDETSDVFGLPVKVNGDRVVTLGDLANIRLTFEDREGTARFNGDATLALQVVKRKGFNIIDMANLVRSTVAAEQAAWPTELQQAVTVSISMDQSRVVGSMVSQLEGSVLTAIALVMIVVLAALGTRSALLVGFAIPTSFLLCFAFLAVMGITVSNIVMFGLILAVGMLVDGAIVVVEYADRRIEEGAGPMTAFTDAAKRMFWPVVSSTATTLCAFLPMLFWPGVPGQFMGMLPVTLIFVLSASLVVALIYLPVMGGVAGRMSRFFEGRASGLMGLPYWVRFVLACASGVAVFVSAMQVLNPGYVLGLDPEGGIGAYLPGALMFAVSAALLSVTMTAAKFQRPRNERIRSGFRRTPFGWAIRLITNNPIMPLVAIGMVGVVVATTFSLFSTNNYGVEFFVDSEPEQAIVYVQARGNHSLGEKDALLRQAEAIANTTAGVESVFAFAGAGGLNQNTGGASAPLDTIGQIQLELVPWEDRPTIDVPWFSVFGLFDVPRTVVDPAFDGNAVIDAMSLRLAEIPGIRFEVLAAAQGPASAKPVHLRIKGDDLGDLEAAVTMARAQFEAIGGLTGIEDSLPLPGIDWQIDVNVAEAGRYGADVATVGAMVQLITRGVLLGNMRVDSSDDEIEIRVRFPAKDRVLSTLDTLRVRTPNGLVPLSNFVTRSPVPKLAQINRVGGQRYYDVKAGVGSELENAEGVVITPGERIAVLTEWLETEAEFPVGTTWEWTGDQEDEAESQAFLSQAFLGALFLMFIILLAQFNSFYNAILVLIAVVLSTTGVLIGMMVMQQPFSVIMTGTGIVALAGIVVNNNIVLIDTYQEYSRYMPRLEAISRTAQMRIRPVLLTTITTMAGLTPMMFGLSLDFFGGGYSVDSPTALWWKQLATAVVFGLGVATVLTLIFTPAMLALRVWIEDGAYGAWLRMRAVSLGKASREARDITLRRSAKKLRQPEVIWDEEGDLFDPEAPVGKPATLRAAE
ncbi:MAG: multidrug efflux pump [Sulfitobacter sp.]|jgi:multidrug efflux pump